MFKDAPFAEHPDWVVMCLKAVQAAPESFMAKEECKLFCSADVSQMAKAKQAVKDACQMHRKGKAWLEACGLSGPLIAKLEGELGVK